MLMIAGDRTKDRIDFSVGMLNASLSRGERYLRCGRDQSTEPDALYSTIFMKGQGLKFIYLMAKLKHNDARIADK